MKKIFAFLLAFMSHAAWCQWSPVGTFTGYVSALGSSGNKLNMGISSSGTASLSVPILSEFDGTSWQNVAGSESWSSSAGIRCIQDFLGKRYVGGQFWMFNGSNVVNTLAFEDSSVWNSVGAPMPNNSFVGGMHVANNKLYVAGSFSVVGSTTLNGVGYWDGSTWSAMGSGIDQNGTGACVQAYNGDIYLGGMFSTAGGTPAENIARWNGVSWSAVGGGISPYSFMVQKMAVYNNELYVCGLFANAAFDSLFHIARWNGTTWRLFNAPLGTSVYDLAVYEGGLYASGTFTAIEGTPANNIARWDGSTWTALSTGLQSDTTVSAYVMCSRPEGLYVGGTFQKAGGQPIVNIAKWVASSSADISSSHLMEANNVYPNPAGSYLSLAFKESSAQLSVSDHLGKVIQTTLLAKGENFSVAEFAEGVYFLRIETATGTSCHKLVVQR